MTVAALMAKCREGGTIVAEAARSVSAHSRLPSADWPSGGAFRCLMLGVALLASCARAGFGQPDARVQDTDSMSHRDAIRADRSSRDGAPLDVKIVAGIKTGILLTCGSSPGNDCRGTLFGGLYTSAMPPFSGFVAGSSVTGADLQAGQVQVVIPGVPPGTYSAWVFLAESGTLPAPPKPVKGDPVMALPVTVNAPVAAPVSVTLPGRWFTD